MPHPDSHAAASSQGMTDLARIERMLEQRGPAPGDEEFLVALLLEPGRCPPGQSVVVKMCLCLCPCTLDGVRASLAGYGKQFATVQQRERPYAAHEWSWEAAARIMAKGGEFKSG